MINITAVIDFVDNIMETIILLYCQHVDNGVGVEYLNDVDNLDNSKKHKRAQNENHPMKQVKIFGRYYKNRTNYKVIINNTLGSIVQTQFK